MDTLYTHSHNTNAHLVSGVPSIFFTEKPLRQFASGLNYTQAASVGSARLKTTNENNFWLPAF